VGAQGPITRQQPLRDDLVQCAEPCTCDERRILRRDVLLSDGPVEMALDHPGEATVNLEALLLELRTEPDRLHQEDLRKITLRRSGLIKIREGLTTLEEVMRETVL